MTAVERRAIAEALGVTQRTLRTWKRDALVGSDRRRGPGRPARSEAAWAAGRAEVQAVLEQLGYQAGEGPVWRTLGERVPLRLVRECLAELKAEHRARTRRARAEARTTIEVLARGALWSLDGTHMGREETGAAVVAELVRDVASTRTLGASIGPPPSSAEVVVLLQRVAGRVGELPLVLAHDNGPENGSDVQTWCRIHDVVELRNVPHTPQHNAWVEHGNGELKAETGLGKGVRVDDASLVAEEIAIALGRIDGARPRATRQWRTAREAYAALPSAGGLVDRRRFVHDVDCAIREAVQDCESARARRLAERRAILKVMEDAKLIKRTRGGAGLPTTKAEDVL